MSYKCHAWATAWGKRQDVNDGRNAIAREHGRKAALNGYRIDECPLEYVKDGVEEYWKAGWREGAASAKQSS